MVFIVSFFVNQLGYPTGIYELAPPTFRAIVVKDRNAQNKVKVDFAMVSFLTFINNINFVKFNYYSLKFIIF